MTEGETKTLLMNELRVTVGNLTIESRPTANPKAKIIGPSVRVCINGVPVNVRRLVLTIDMKEIVTAQVEFFPVNPEADSGVTAERMPRPRTNCKTCGKVIEWDGDRSAWQHADGTQDHRAESKNLGRWAEAEPGEAQASRAGSADDLARQATGQVT